jgi:hypothetical protein
MPLFMCCFSFLSYICRRSATCNGKKNQLHVLLRFVETTTLLVSFDLWMSKSGVGTFASVINYLNELGCP